MSIPKPTELTAGEADILKLLCNGCNIALYRGGQARLRDKNHNPVQNVRMELFERIRKYTVQREGLFYINPETISSLPKYVQQ